jgi:hypothetical protein
MTEESKPLYCAINGENFVAILWDTPKGKILTVKGEINPNYNIEIKEAKTGKTIKDIDMRNVLMDIIGVSR